nr:hypothetical protein [Tanacetum cinerariifolium]
MEEEEEVASEGQQQAVSVVDTATSKPLGLGYGEARRRAFESTEEIAPISPSSLVVPSPIASLVATPAATVSRYRFRSIEREKERSTMTFSAIWRSMLALEAWGVQTDAQRIALWHAIYDIQRENHDLRGRLLRRDVGD